MNKRIVIIVMLLAAVAARAFDFSATAPTGQTVYYSIIGSSTVKVVNPDWDYYTQPSGFLTLPSTVEYNAITYNVTAIDIQAFMSCESLTGVSVPEGVTSIGRMAFAFCSALDSIVLPTTLDVIGTMAFTGTAYYSNNDNITPEGLMFIGSYLIAARPSIADAVEVPSGTLGLGNMAFYNCQQMPKIQLPSTLRFIGENAFSNCVSLDTVWMIAFVPPTLESNSFLDVPDFVVSVPCGARGTYLASENWSNLTIIQRCNKPDINPFPPIPIGIDDIEEFPFTVVAVEGGLQIVLPDGYGCTVNDVLGRTVATLRNSGFVPLSNKGLYLVGIPQFGKTVKVIFNN